MKIVLSTLLLGTLSLMAADGASLYEKCAACHGADGMKPALNKTGPVAGLDKATMVADLKAYKAGTLNKSGMGNLMKMQMAPFSDADIEAVSAYMANMK